MITIHIISNYVNTHCNLKWYSVIALVWYVHVLSIKSGAKCYVSFKLQQGFRTCLMINTFFHKLHQWYLYSSVRKFVITDTGENWYMTNNNQFTVFNLPYSGKFSLGSYFRDFANCIRSRENKNRNNLFQQKFILWNLTSIYWVFKRIKFVCYYCWFI